MLDVDASRSATPAATRRTPQRMAALARANDVRFRRSWLKRDLKAGRTGAFDVLEDLPEWAEAMAVIELLLALPGFGRCRAKRALLKCRVGPSMELGQLTPRQRMDLMVWLRQAELERRRRAA
jgi:hypothetical protein